MHINEMTRPENKYRNVAYVETSMNKINSYLGIPAEYILCQYIGKLCDKQYYFQLFPVISVMSTHTHITLIRTCFTS